MKIRAGVLWTVVVMLLLVMGAAAQDVATLTTPNAMSRVTKKVAPEFPAAARQLNVNGQSEVSIVVGAQGDVEDAKVVKGNALFSQASLSAVKQWKFTPLMKDGAAVKFSTVITFNYMK